MQKQNMTEKYCFGKKRLKKGGMWSKNQLCYIFYYWHLINAFCVWLIWLL